MKSVNLIPVEHRRGGAGGSGNAVYIALGALGVLVVAVALYVLASNTVTHRESELARVTQETSQAQAQLAATQPYNQFAALRQARVTTIQQLAASRFSWQTAFDKLARVIPSDVWLTSLTGTVTPGVSLQSTGGAAAGATSPLRSADPAPAVELVGCTTNQAEVSRVMSRLRLIDGVSRVSLAASEKQDQSAPANGTPTPGGSGSVARSADCRHGSAHFPQFQVVVFFGAGK